MASALFSFKVDDDGEVRVLHVFFAKNQPKAEAEMHEHADACPKFGPALRADKTIEFEAEIDELPPADPDALAEWFEEFFTCRDAEDDDDDDER